MAGQSKSIDVSYEQLSAGKFVRTTNDLSITTKNLSGDSETVLLKDYFLTSPDLVTSKGSTLKGDIVNLLAINSQPSDHGMVAFEDPQAIGKITTADGAVTVQRVNTTIQLNEGDFIYLNDVIESNASSVGIAFADETTMSVDPNSKMVIDDFVYDPEEPTTGSMSANVIEGNFSFVSGQIAKVGNDAMTVTTPVLTIGVRGTQVAGKANTEGEDNEIVLLPNNDGTVGQIMIANQSGEVLLTKPYEATIIANAYVPPTVPVVLPKAEVLKKFAATISTTRKTEAKAEVERDTEEAVREKEKAEDEQEELEEEKEELEEEAEALEEEKEELEENIEELEEEAEEAEKEAEELEEKVEEALEEKQEAEDKKEEVAEEIEQLEEELAEASTQEKQAIEKELEKLEEEFVEIEEEVAEIEKEIEVVEEKKAVVDKKVEQIEKDFVEAKEDFVEVEQKAEIVEKEVQQVIEQELVIEQEIKMVEQKFEAIVEKFEVFQKDFAIEFQDFIPEAEIQQFIEEAPEELVEEFKENIVEQLEKENEIIRIEKEVEEQELQEISEEDPFSEENVEEKLEEIDDNINELKETEQELNDKGKQLQNVEEELREESSELEEESREIQEKGEALNEKNRELEEREQQAIENNDREALEELQQEFDALDKEQSALYEQSQELDKEFDQVNEQYNELNEEYQDLSEEYQELDQEFREFDDMATNNNFFYNDDNKELDIKTGMDEFNSQVRPEDQVLVDVDDFIAQEKAKVLENSEYAQEADNFFNNDNILLNNDISQQVQDLIVINFQYLDEYVMGVGNNINNLDDYENNFEDDSHLEVIDANAELYQLSLESDYWFDMWVQQQVADDINVAPWLNLQGDVTKVEATAVDSLLFSFGASDANGDRLTYSIFNDPTGRLRIEGQNVYLDQSFSVTEDTTYQIILKVQDPYGASDVDHIYLTVENNHSPEIANTSAVSLAENVSVGEDIATMYASDAEGEAKTWSITAGNDSNLFTINSSTGLIETAAALDYETATSHTLTITATDAFGNTSTVNQVVNVTDVNEVTQYTKGVNFGSIATWGNKFSEDTVQDNSWTQETALLISNSDIYSLQARAKANLEAEGFIVTEKTIDDIISGGYSEMQGYTMVFELNWSDESVHGSSFSGTQVGSYSSAVEAAFEDYLQSGGSLYKAGELNGTGYNTQNQNAKDLLAEIGGNMTWSGSSSAAGTLNSDYRVGPITDATSIGSGFHAVMWSTDGSQMNTNNSSWEWGPNVLDTNIQGTMMVKTDFNYLASNGSTTAKVNEFKTYANFLFDENEANSNIATYDMEYIPVFKSTQNSTVHTAENDITEVQAFHLGDKVHIGGGMSHIDWARKESGVMHESEVAQFDVSGQETGAREMHFSSDGTKFFLTGYQGKDVGEYHLSTAWNVSTASYDSAFSVSSQTTGGHGLEFNTDGTKMYVGGYGSQGQEINEYNLSTGWDVSTASFVRVLDISDYEAQPRGITFSSDGTKLIIAGAASDEIDEWTLSTGWDLSTASYTDNLDVSSYDNDPRGIEFNSDGTLMFMSGSQNDQVHVWDLSTGWDLSTSTYKMANTLANFDGAGEGITFNGDGTKFYVAGNNDNTVDQYQIAGEGAWGDAVYWAFNADMDNGATPTQADDHYGVIGYDRDGDSDLWETTDTFDLDKIKIVDDSVDYLAQDSDISGEYYFKVTPVTYANNSWTVETDNTVTLANTSADNNNYLDLSSNTDFDDINYALIETESALISEVIVSA
jgi:predicted  nucleic acid-binding Zn-ribbon protein